MTKKHQAPNPVPAVAPAGFSIMTAEEKVARARQWLLRNRPMWGSLLMRLKVREDKQGKTKTMVTDGRVVAWARPFVDALSVEHVTTVFAHEVGHCMLKHVFRQKGRDPKAWGEACDHVVNLLLIEDGFSFPKGMEVHRDPQFASMSAEQVYPIILAQHEAKRQEEQQEQEQQQKQKGSKQEQDEEQESQEGEGQESDDESMGEMAEPGTLGDPDDEQPSDKQQKKEKGGKKQKKEKQEKNDNESKGEAESKPEKGDDSEPGDEEQSNEPKESGDGEEGEGEDGDEPSDESDPDDGEGGDSGGDQAGEGEEPGEAQPLSEAEQRALEGDWSQAAAAAAQQALQRGHGSRNEQRVIQSSIVQPRSFEEFMDYFIQKCTDRSQESWRRRSRRSMASDVYLPGRRGQKTGPLVVVIDTSGSINEKALWRFIANVEKAQEELRPSHIIALYADDDVASEVRFEKGEQFEVRSEDVKGYGGTDFRPAFKRVMQIQEEEGIEVAGVLYLTDLDGDMPKKEDAIEYPPTLWCFDSSNCYTREEHNRILATVTFGEVAELQI